MTETGRIEAVTTNPGGGSLSLHSSGSTPTLRRRLLVVMALVTLLGVISAPSAAAQPIEREAWEFQFNGFPEWLEQDCGITGVYQEVDIRGWWSFNTARSEFGHYMEWAKGTNTFTSIETGKTFTLTFNSLWKDQSVRDNGDGTVTIVIATPFRQFVYGPDGTVLFRDTGTTWWELIYDVDADEELSWRMLRSVGHQDTNDRDFCDDLREFILP